MNNKYWELVGYVKRSKNRVEALKLFDKRLMPSELSKMMNISLTHGSKIIRELNSKRLIKCLNEELKVGRIYELSELGMKVRTEILGKSQ